MTPHLTDVPNRQWMHLEMIKRNDHYQLSTSHLTHYILYYLLQNAPTDNVQAYTYVVSQLHLAMSVSHKYYAE